MEDWKEFFRNTVNPFSATRFAGSGNDYGQCNESNLGAYSTLLELLVELLNQNANNKVRYYER